MSDFNKLKLLSSLLDKVTPQNASLRFPIVPVEQWVIDPYYVGKDGLKLYPFWRDFIIKIFKDGQKYNEIIITGGIGGGKSTVAYYILLRKLYELSCYNNIAGLFNLMSTASTVFFYFCISLYQAERTGFSQFRSMIDSIPYFKERFRRDEHLNSVLKFPENVRFMYGSDASQCIGMNMIASILDEANFFEESSKVGEEAYSKVINLHTSILNRQKSRFKNGSVDNSLSILVSSSTYASSYTQKRIEAVKDDPTALVVSVRVFEVKPKGTYSDTSFYVFLGDEKIEPFLIETVSVLNSNLGLDLDESLTPEEVIDKVPPQYRTLIDSIPVDFYDQYKSNLIQAIQDISGYSVAPQGRLFTARSLFNMCISDELPDLFIQNQFPIATQDDSESNHIEWYLSKPFEHKECTRYIHIDQSYATDRTGFASCYKFGTVTQDGQELPVFYLDFAIRIEVPPPPRKISISRVREFVYYMRDVEHIKLGKVTYDTFASAESIQNLVEHNVNAATQSVDRTDDAYLFFCELIYQHRIFFSQKTADLMASELFDLIHFRDRRKVDHPPTNSKDVMDAVVGAVWNCAKNEDVCVNLEDLKTLASYNVSKYSEYLENESTLHYLGNNEDGNTSWLLEDYSFDK